MDFEDNWAKALKSTEIIRARVKALLITGMTKVPYIMLSESSLNIGDTVVRTGEVLIDKPALVIPPNNPSFSGFEFEQETNFHEEQLINFLIVRGISFPSFRYDNKTSSMDIFEDKMAKAIAHYEKFLQQTENVSTGLIKSSEECWQYSLLIFICTQIVKNAQVDIQKLLDEFKDDGEK